jgi:signal transduction histidine kinase
LLVVRLTELERVAWRDGRASARRLERRARELFLSNVAARMRRADLLAHDAHSEFFAIALAARRRGRGTPLPADCRSALARAEESLQALSAATETGWTLMNATRDFAANLRVALRRGESERQRLDFFSPIAHEMRTPLTAIRGYLETVLDESLDASTTRRFLETARGEALRLGRLIDGMFAVSLLDLEYGAPKRERDETLPQTAVDRAIAALMPRVRERRANIECAVLPAVPVAATFDHLVQVFVNVIGNAVEHGKERGRVVIAGVQHGRALEITVDDDGPGIALGERDAVFDFGYRSPAAAASTGSGLGLAVVRRLLERTCGTIAATSSPLGGARFVIRLQRLPQPKDRPG